MRRGLRAPDGVALECVEPGHHDAVTGVIVAAFGEREGPTVAAMVEGIRAGEYARPELEWVATRGGEVVGHTALSGTTLRGESGARVILMLTPLAVAPHEQRRGIGSALVEHVVGLADAAGEPLIVLEGSPRYYARFGFVPAAPRGIHIDLPDWAPAEAGQVRLLRAFGDQDPGLRGHVVYPPYVPTG